MHRALLILIAAGACWAADPAVSSSLVTNGDFTAGWTNWSPNEADKTLAKVSLQSEDGNTFLHLAQPTQVLSTKHLVIDPSWKKLHISCRIRLADFKPNTDISWGNARLANSFIMPEGKQAYVGIVLQDANTDPGKDGGWKTLATVVEIPAGALEFEVVCGNYGTAGQTDFDDIVVTAEQ